MPLPENCNKKLSFFAIPLHEEILLNILAGFSRFCGKNQKINLST
jgi:hypothetical protein